MPERPRGRVMLVDDNESLHALLRDIFSDQKGIVLTCFGTGAEALDAIHGAPPDLLLLDLMLPDMDGREVVRELRRRPETRGLRIIAVTVLADDRSRLEVMAAGFDGYIRKPFGIEEIRDAVRKTLGEIAAERAAEAGPGHREETP